VKIVVNRWSFKEEKMRISRKRIAVISAVAVIVVVLVLVLVWHPWSKPKADTPLQGGAAEIMAELEKDCGDVTMYTSGSITPVSTFNSCPPKLISSLAIKVLDDKKVTTEELEEVKDSFISCLTKAGLTDISVQNDGSDNYKYPENMTSKQADTAYNQCGDNTAWGPVCMEYMREHPDPQVVEDSKNNGTVFIPCLVEAGLLPPTYTVEQYKKDPASIAQYDLTGPTAIDCFNKESLELTGEPSQTYTATIAPSK
jgi:hypothetical protein